MIVRVSAHCRRRYRRACGCRVPATVTTPGPPKAIGKGLVSNAFIAHLLTERYVAGRSQNSLVTDLARHGAELSPATLTGTCAAAGALLAPLEAAVTARSRGAWHLHADETVRHEAPGRPLSLPLLDDVGWAIIDYVRDGRPETACPKVFVKHRHPFDAFGCASSVASRLTRHAARAGIEFGPGQVCGMHSLRGALAVAMIGDGTPMPVVSAVLGHASSDTTQAYYLRFDVERLRGCALDVEDITERDRAGERGV